MLGCSVFSMTEERYELTAVLPNAGEFLQALGVAVTMNQSDVIVPFGRAVFTVVLRDQ